MGNSSGKTPPVIARCRAPVYSIKRMGSRHLLLAGGGGASKTGVPNNIETFLITFDPNEVTSPPGALAKLCGELSTGSFATMNMDVVATAPADEGLYLIAAGHDQYCDIYESTGFQPCDGDSDANGSKVLSFKLRDVTRLTTDECSEGSYQKCVRFDRSRSGKLLVTGGSDGHVRVWDAQNIVMNRGPEVNHQPLVDIAAHTAEVDDIDISHDGSLIASVGNEGKVFLWDINTGQKVLELPIPIELQKKCRVRTLRFTPLGDGRHIFVAAYNEIQRTSKSSCYVALWAFNRERNACRPIVVREAARGESISNLCISPCGDFTGVGTLGGSVGIFDTHEMRCLMWKKETHDIFVTGVEFLDRVSRDLRFDQDTPDSKPHPLPGAAAAWRAALVSLSADQTVQLHTLPLVKPEPLAIWFLRISLILLLVNVIIYMLLSL